MCCVCGGGRRRVASQTSNLPRLCKDGNTLIPFAKRAPGSDKFKIYIRPLECNRYFTYFKTRTKGFDTEKFWKWCVDFDRGDSKPQIRVHDSISLFNITNFA